MADTNHRKPLRFNLAERLNRPVPMKLFFTKFPPGAQLHELARVFESRFQLADISLHQGYGYAYVNDIDAEERSVRPLYYRGKPLTVTQGLRYFPDNLPSQMLASSTGGDTNKDFDLDKLNSQLNEIDWNKVDTDDVRKAGLILRDNLIKLQAIYKGRFCPREGEVVMNDENNPERVDEKYRKIREIAKYNSQDVQISTEKSQPGPIRQTFATLHNGMGSRVRSKPYDHTTCTRINLLKMPTDKVSGGYFDSNELIHDVAMSMSNLL